MGKMRQPGTYKGIAYSHLALHNDAQDSFEQTLSIDENCAAAWYQKGLVLFEQERFEESLSAFERALEIAPGVQDHAFRKALSLFMLGRFQDAAGISDLALTLGPETSVIQYYRGRAFAEISDYPKALEAFNRALDLIRKTLLHGLRKVKSCFLKITALQRFLPLTRLSFLTRNPQMLRSIKENPLPCWGTMRKHSGHTMLYLASIPRIPMPRIKKGWHCPG